jgi:hypothetical protein
MEVCTISPWSSLVGRASVDSASYHQHGAASAVHPPSTGSVLPRVLSVRYTIFHKPCGTDLSFDNFADDFLPPLI